MKKLTQIEAENRITEYNSNLIVLSNYIARNKRIIVKDEDGIIYSVLADKLFVGKIPSLATAIDKSRGFIVKANKIHNNKYLYENVNYINNNTKVIITCPLHGDFTQLPTNHLAGQGCPECGKESARLKWAENGFSRTSWIAYCKNNNKQARLYVIKCYNNNEIFIKIGITTKEISKRFWKTNMPYKYNILFEEINTPEIIYDKEKSYHIRFKKYKYIPMLDFDGYRECFDVKIENKI